MDAVERGGEVGAELGDSIKKLDHPQIVPVFLGIAAGVVLGMWPISVPERAL